MAQVLALLSRPGSKRYRLQLEVLTRLWQYEEAGKLPTSARFIYYELGLAPRGCRGGVEAPVLRDTLEIVFAVIVECEAASCD